VDGARYASATVCSRADGIQSLSTGYHHTEYEAACGARPQLIGMSGDHALFRSYAFL